MLFSVGSQSVVFAQNHEVSPLNSSSTKATLSSREIWTQAAKETTSAYAECTLKSLYNMTVGNARDAKDMAASLGKAWWSQKKLEMICLTTPWNCHKAIQEKVEAGKKLAVSFQETFEAIPGWVESFNGMNPKAKIDLLCPFIHQTITEMGIGAAITAATGGAGAPALIAKISMYGHRIKAIASLATKLQRLPGSSKFMEAMAKLSPSNADKFIRLSPDKAEALAKGALHACSN